MSWWLAILVFIAGLGIGLFYYGGLWLTVSYIAAERGRGASLLAISFIARLAITLGLLFVAGGGRLAQLLVAVAGFFIVRFWAVRRWGLPLREN